jgi:transposase
VLLLFLAGIHLFTANYLGMKNTAKTPTTTEQTWQERALKAEAQVELLSKKIGQLEDQMRLLTAKRFGPSSEKTNKNQMKLFDFLFNEAEATAEPFAPEPELITVPGHKRAKAKGKRDQIFEGLPENIIEYHLPEEELACSCCGNQRHVIKQEITRELRFVPAQLSVDVHVQNIYGCRQCQEHGDGSSPVVVAAPKPNRAFTGSIASPSLVASIIDEKYVMGTPLYRLEQQWARRGPAISRQNMSNWVIHAAQSWLEPIYEHMKAELLKQNIAHADETTVQVLHEDGKKSESKSYMWLYRSGRYGPGIVLYEYQPSRAREHPREFLQGFKGYLVTDGYAAYNGIPDVTNAGCWSHARRGFDEALKAAGKAKKDSKAMEGLEFCNKLFSLEREFVDYEPEKRYEERLLQSEPLLEAFLAWLHETKDLSLPQSHLGKAIQYCLNQWEPLNTFLLDGRLEISNNLAERSIKPFVIGRKNFLFCNTPKGAKASAITYSLVESAKENGLKPYEYIEYLLQELPNANSSELDRFMPWSEQIPDHCRSPKRK